MRSSVLRVVRFASAIAMAVASSACSSRPEDSPVALLEPGAPQASPETPANARASARTVVGTSVSVLDNVLQASGRKSSSSFAFLNDVGEEIAVHVEDFFFQDGYLSMTGTAQEPGRSSFILKGDSRQLYGWVVLNDRDLAYEYTTAEDGHVVVEKVPVTKIYPVCELDTAAGREDPVHEDLGLSRPHQAGDPPHVGDYDGSDTSKLQSLPGAKKVLYLEYAPLGFEPAELWRVWQAVAAAYSAFDVNVTSDAAVYQAAGTANAGKACFTKETGRSFCCIGCFGTNKCCTVNNARTGVQTGATAAHELGHMMGLQHDGGPGAQYFAGFPEFKWCPIMGKNILTASWGQQQLYQWSKGEYTGATTTQDDLAIISRQLPYRADDIPNAKPLEIVNGTELPADKNRGQIASNTDTDTFTFSIGATGGHVTLTVDRIELYSGAYLDVDAAILDAAGTVVAQSNEKAARNAKFDLDVKAGDYQLVIKGGAEGTPQNGFSKYSSLGYYGVVGKITGASTGGTGGTGAGGMAGAGGTGAGGMAGTGAGGTGAGGMAGTGAGGTGTGGMAGTGAGGTGLGGMAGKGGTGAGGAVDAGASGGAGGAGGNGGTATGGTGGAGGTAGTGPSGAGGRAGSSGRSVGNGAPSESGCACRLPQSQSSGSSPQRNVLLTGLVIGLASWRRRQRAVSETRS